MRVCMLRSGDVCYDSLAFFDGILREGFEACGCEVVMAERSYTSMSQYFDNCDMVIGFNIQADTQISDGTYLLDQFGVPFVNVLADPPYAHHKGVNVKLQQYYVVCLDDFDLRYLERYYPHIKGAIRGSLCGGRRKKGKRMCDRSMDILFTGTFYNDIEVRNQIESLGSVSCAVCDRLIDIYQEDRFRPLGVELEKIMGEYGLLMEKSEFLDYASLIFSYVDNYIRQFARRTVLEELAGAGLSVYVCGKGWDQLACAGADNFTILPPVSFSETAELIGDARILLNIASWPRVGIHDRVITAMKNQTVCLTNQNPVMERDFEEGKEYIGYTLDKIGELPGRLSEMLQDLERCEEIAKNGYVKAEREFTMRGLAEKILHMVSESGAL